MSESEYSSALKTTGIESKGEKGAEMSGVEAHEDEGEDEDTPDVVAHATPDKKKAEKKDTESLPPVAPAKTPAGIRAERLLALGGAKPSNDYVSTRGGRAGTKVTPLLIDSKKGSPAKPFASLTEARKALNAKKGPFANPELAAAMERFPPAKVPLNRVVEGGGQALMFVRHSDLSTIQAAKSRKSMVPPPASLKKVDTSRRFSTGAAPVRSSSSTFSSASTSS